MVQVILGIGIFAATLGAILARPARISEAQAALLGAAAMLVTGIVRPEQAVTAVLHDWNVYLFFLGLMISAALAEQAGVFRLLAGYAVRWAGGSTRRLYAAVFAIGVGVTAVLSNDATAILLTPVVAALVLGLDLPPMPFLFATTFIADTASFLLPVSNPINVLVLGEQIDLALFLRFLFVPGVLASATNYLVFAWWFRDDLRGHYDPARWRVVLPNDRSVAHRMLIGLVGLALAYVLGSWMRLPLGLVAVSGALTLGLLAWATGTLTWSTLRRGISWSLFGFLTGMVVIVQGLHELAITERFGALLLALGEGSSFRAILVTAFGAALGSNLINNVPMALVMRATLSDAGLPASQLQALQYATVLGADLGPNVTTVGSLATILWVLQLRRYGITVSLRQYLFLGLLVVPPMLLIGTLMIWLQT